MLATIVALTPFVAAAITRIRHAGALTERWGDLALIELATDDVGAQAVLLGPYSRFGWHHPGPALFYLLAIPYRLVGSHPVGISLGGILITGAAATGIAWVAYRRGGRPLLLWTLVVVGLFVHAGGPIVVDFWNPLVTMLPFALVVMLAWSVACRDIWAFPALVGVASFVVQSHVGYMPAVLVVTASGTALGVVAIMRVRGTPRWHEERRRAVKAVTVAVAIASALWILPLLEQFTHEPGNVGLLASYWRHAESGRGLRESFDIASAELGVIAGSAVGRTEVPGSATGGTFNWTVIVSAGTLVVAGLAAAHRHWWDQVILACLTAVTWVVAVYSVSRIVGPALPYLVAWISALGIPLWVMVGAITIRFATNRPPGKWPNQPRLRTGAVATIVFVIALIAANSINLEGPRRTQRTELVSDTLAVADAAVADAECGPIRIRVGPGSKWLSWAVVLHLEHQGADFAAERSPITQLHLGDWDLIEPADVGTVLALSRPRGGKQLEAHLEPIEYSCEDKGSEDR